MIASDLYRYACRLVRVIDGDTIVVEVDLGFNQWMHNQHVRLFGINTPELIGKDRLAALKAKQFVESWAKERQLYLHSRRYDEREKYGRILASVFRDDGACLNDDLLRAGLAGAI